MGEGFPIFIKSHRNSLIFSICTDMSVLDSEAGAEVPEASTVTQDLMALRGVPVISLGFHGFVLYFSKGYK